MRKSFIHSFTLSNTQEREKSLIFQTLSFPIFFSVVSSNTDYSHHHHARACILCLIFYQPTSTISINLYEDGKCSNIGRPLKMYASSQIYFNFFHYFCNLFEGNSQFVTNFIFFSFIMLFVRSLVVILFYGCICLAILL